MPRGSPVLASCRISPPGGLDVSFVTAPERMVPAAIADPFARLQGLRVLLDAPDKLLRGRGVMKVHRRELKPAADEMGVSVSEARKHEPAVRLNPLRVGAHIAPHLRAVADREDPAAGDS